ncbi:putative PAP2 superfamily [Blattamonas nauphoetae]|uniref:PAP2 superfamily n=1 Tax=Blattamonas nauphoetae TaxID=2049346 RepID=A0ABQ9Y147_9EUKA|nr:putative PAP2 superfamily [Blattamonas nauphoetae]
MQELPVTTFEGSNVKTHPIRRKEPMDILSDMASRVELFNSDIWSNTTRRSFLVFLLDVVIHFIPCISYVTELIPRKHHQFHFDDPAISYRTKDKVTVSTPLLGVFSVALLIPTVILQFFRPYPLLNLHVVILSLLLSFGVCIGFVSVIKLFVPRFRPDFLSRCQVDQTMVAEQTIKDMARYGRVLAHDWKCLGTGLPKSLKIIEEGRKSFPSGHATTSMWSACLSSWYLFEFGESLIKWAHNPSDPSSNPFISCRRSHSASPQKLEPTTVVDVVRRSSAIRFRDQTFPILVRVVCLALSIAMFTLSTFIAGSRVVDHVHHLTDVLAGTVFGILGGCFGGWYHRYRRKLLIQKHRILKLSQKIRADNQNSA